MKKIKPEFCSSNVLWFMATKLKDGEMHVTPIMIAKEFGVNTCKASAQIGLLIDGGMLAIISSDVYQLTETGVEEINWLGHFVKVTSKYKVNPRSAVKMSVKIREWFPGESIKGISAIEVKICKVLSKIKKRWRDDEIDLALRLLEIGK